MPVDPIAAAARAADDGLWSLSLQELAAVAWNPDVGVAIAESASAGGMISEASNEAHRVLAWPKLDDQARSRCLVVLAAVDRREGRHTTARHLLAEARELSSPRVRPLIDLELARLEHQQGRHAEVERAVDRAVLGARVAENERWLVEAWMVRAWSRLAVGDHDGGRVTLQELTSLARRIGHEPGRTEASLAAAHLALAHGDLSLAEDSAKWSSERYERAGDSVGRGRALTLLGLVARAKRDLDVGLRLFSQAIRLHREVRDPALAPRLHSGHTLWDLGRADEARAALDDLLADAERCRDRNILGVAHALRMACAVTDHDAGAWERHLVEAEASLQETGVASTEAALAARAAGLEAGARGRPDDLARAARCHGLALQQWRRSGKDQQAVEEARSLRRWADQGAAVPCGDWNLLERVGYGAMGEVWRARHHVRGVEAAVKLLISSEAGNHRLAAVVAAEIRAVASLQHPHIVEVLDHGTLSPTAEAMTQGRQRADAPWFAMTLARGGTLEPRCGRLPWADARRVLLAILDALAHAHARGVIHLDLKPANVLLDPRPDGDRVLLTDFGLTGALATSKRGPGLLGTPQMMSPEQFREDASAFGPWTDLYALGCLATQLVQGNPPFPGRSLDEQRNAHLTQDPPPLEPTISVPLDLEDWIARLLAKRPSDRFRSAADAAWALQQLGEPETVPTVALPFSPVHLSTLSLSHLSGRNSGPTFRHPAGPSIPVDWKLPAQPRSPDHAAASLQLFRVRRPAMVDQDEARDLAWSALADASRSGARALWVLGPPGSGKTRFLEWLRELAHERGAATTLSVSADRPLWPSLLEPLVASASVSGAFLDRLRAAWPALDEDAAQQLANAPAEEANTRRARIAAYVRLATLAAAERTLLIVASGRPIHGELLDLVDELQRTDAPVLVALEGSANAVVHRGERCESVELRPLRADHLERMVHELLPLPANVRAAVAQRASGNPQLAVELLTDLVDRRLLRWNQGQYDLKDAGALALPAHVRELWRNRLERALVGVAGAERPAVVLGALLGEVVPVARWEEGCERLGVRDPAAVLQRLQRSWLVQLDAGGGWRFLHPVLREEAQTLAERDGDLARASKVAAAVLGATSAAADAARIGRLLALAGELESALEPLQQGLEQAMGRDDRTATEELLALRADVLRRVGAPPTDARWAADALARCELALRKGELPIANDEARRAIQLAPAGLMSAKAQLLRARCERASGELERARDAYAAALAVGATDEAFVARALFGLGEILRLRGDLEAAEVHLEMARASVPRHLDEHVSITLSLGLAVGAQARLDEALQWVDEARERAQQLGIRSLEARASATQAQLLRWADQPERARAACAEGLASCPHRDKACRAELNLQLVWLELGQRDDDAARALWILAERDADDRPSRARLAVAGLSFVADGPAFEPSLERARAALELGLREPDIALGFEIAAARAPVDRARVCWALAADTWRALSRPRDAKRAERALASLARRTE
jgi:serine/threonine protein kinase